MEKQHILITYTNTGAGHKTPALAIAKRIEDLYPNTFNITTSNFFEDVGEISFNTYIEKSWDFLLKNPWITKILISVARIFYKIAPLYVKVCHKKVWYNSIKYLKSVNPDIILTTHFFTQTIAIDAKEIYNLKYSVLALNPDTFETFPQWDRRGDLLLVCSDIAQQSAIALGHNEKNIRIVPQALRQEFNQEISYNSQELRKQIGFREDVFTILMSDGGQGIGKMYMSILQLIKSQIPLNIIAICGKNEKLYTKLLKKQAELKEKNHLVQIQPYGFVNNVTTFIHMSDLFIGKSGPASIMECLKLGLPVLINFSANSAERKTAHYFISQKVALSCSYIYLLPKKIERIIQNPQILTDIKDKLKVMDFFQDGSSIIVNLIVQYLENKSEK